MTAFDLLPTNLEYNLWKRSYRCLVANVLDCDIVLSEFKLQACNYVHLRTNTIGKKYEPPFLSGNMLNSTTSVLLLG